MKKEQQIVNRKTGIVFKLCTLLALIIAIVIVWVEVKGSYFLSKIHSEEKAYVMDVNIETSLKNTEIDPQESEQLDNLEKELNKNLISEISPPSSPTPIITEADLDSYRLYLMQVMYLVEKVSSQEDYHKELEFLLQNNSNYSSEITDILLSLAEYRNKYLTSKDPEYKKLSLDGGLVTKVMNKIVHVEQKNPDHQMQIDDYRILKSKIHILEEYFYSKEFLKRYLSND